MEKPQYDANQTATINNLEKLLSKCLKCSENQTSNSSEKKQAMEFNPSGFVITLLCYSITAFLVLFAFCLNFVFRTLFSTGLLGTSSDTEPMQYLDEADAEDSSRRSSVSSVASYSSPTTSQTCSPFSSPAPVRKLKVPTKEEWANITSRSRNTALCFTDNRKSR